MPAGARTWIRLGALVVPLYVLMRGSAAMLIGYPWSDMDWNTDGLTTPTEVWRAMSIGRRQVVQGGQTCIEYFALKDASTVKLICREP